MSRPAAHPLGDAHRVVAHKIRVLADLHCASQFFLRELGADVEAAVAVAAGDAVAAGAFWDAVRADVEVVPRALAAAAEDAVRLSLSL